MTPALHLILATAAFVGTHFLLSHPLRASLVARLGPGGFLGIYSLIAAATLVWIWLAATAMPYEVPRWLAPLWVWGWFAPIVMLLVSILLAGSLMRNPAFPNPGASAAQNAMRPATGVFAITRHPLNWAFMLWAVTHIALTGSTDNLVIAGGIMILALFGSILQDRKKAGLLGDAWRGWEARTSFVPFGALLDGRIPWRAAWPGLHALAAGLVIWLAATWLHQMPVGPWRWIG